MSVIRYNNLKIPGVITTPFNGKTRDDPNHKGIDIANKSGTPIPAFDDGVVVATGKKRDGAGNVVILKDKEGNVHQYSHLQGAVVTPGTKVKKGQEIAKMGKTGNVYSPTNSDPSHLDLRIVNRYNKYINPMTYLNKK